MCTNISQFDPINMETTKIAEDTSSIQHPVQHGSAAKVPITHEDDQERSTPESGEKHESDSINESSGSAQTSESNSDHTADMKQSHEKEINMNPQVASPPPQGQQANNGQLPFPCASPYGYPYPYPYPYPYMPLYYGGFPTDYNTGMPSTTPTPAAGTETNTPTPSVPPFMSPHMQSPINKYRCVFPTLNSTGNAIKWFVLCKPASKEKYLTFIKEMIDAFNDNDMSNLVPTDKKNYAPLLSREEQEYVLYVHSTCVDKTLLPAWYTKGIDEGTTEAQLIQQAMMKVLRSTGPANAIAQIGKFKFRQNWTVSTLYAEGMELIEDAARADNFHKCIERAVVISVLHSLPEKHRHLVPLFESKDGDTLDELCDFLGSHLGEDPVVADKKSQSKPRNNRYRGKPPKRKRKTTSNKEDLLHNVNPDSNQKVEDAQQNPMPVLGTGELRFHLENEQILVQAFVCQVIESNIVSCTALEDAG